MRALSPKTCFSSLILLCLCAGQVLAEAPSSLSQGPLVAVPPAAQPVVESTPSKPTQQAIRQEASQHLNLASLAFQQQDFKGYLEHLQKVVSLRPEQPLFLYRLAGAQALNGLHDEALTNLTRLAGMGLDLPVEADPALESLLGLPAFAPIQARFVANRQPIGKGQTVFTLGAPVAEGAGRAADGGAWTADTGLLTEGLAYDPVTEAHFISSVRQHKILRRSKEGVVTEFSQLSDGLWAVLGLRVDAKRRELWACSAALPQTQGLKPEEAGRSGLFRYDLRTGALLERYLLPTDAPHALGDLWISSEGDVFTTDSQTPALYVLRRGSSQLKPLLAGEPLISPQGLAFVPSLGLVVADYAGGLYQVDVTTGSAVRLPVPADQALLGIDGLYSTAEEGEAGAKGAAHPNEKGKGKSRKETQKETRKETQKADRRETAPALIAIQNGTQPARILKLRLEPSPWRVTGVDVLLANDPLMEEPTLGVLVDDQFQFIANSQWERFDEQGKLKSGQVVTAPHILSVQVSAPAR